MSNNDGSNSSDSGPEIRFGALSDVVDDDQADVLKELLWHFVSTSAMDALEIYQGILERDLTKVTHGAHNLKASAAIVGASEVQGICSKLDIAGNAENWEDVLEFAARLAGSLSNTIHEISQQML